MRQRVSRRLVAVAAAAVLGVGAGCDSKKDPTIGPQPDSGFLGYSGAAERTPTCGNCHVSQTSRWAETAHADAWATLEASGHAQDFCGGCHTVSSRGNFTNAPVAWEVTGDARYHDVQCESCHGPGLEHVNVPDGGTKPLASIRVLEIGSPSRGADTTFVGCGECHSGNHHPFVDEWSRSRHSKVRTSSTSDCGDCHSAQGAFQAWGIDANYAERADDPSDHVGIVCAVCHDPHAAKHPGQLRYAIDEPTEQLNLCIRCHHKRAAPEIEASTLRGPHSPEGPLLLGTAGWWPPGFGKGAIETTHGPVGNERMCATCHVVSTTITDQETGAFLVNSTGHLFQAIPCTDSNGIPIPDGGCNLDQRTFAACADCHGSEDIARTAYTDRLNRVAAQVAELDTLIAQSGDFDPSDGVFTVADGVWFNARLAEKKGSPIHNPRLIEELMVASRQVMLDTYP